MEAMGKNFADSFLLIIQLLDQIGVESYGVELKVVNLVSLEVGRNCGWVNVRTAVGVHFRKFNI